MSWKDIIKQDWPKHIKKDKKRYSLFKVIGKKGTYRNPDVEKDLHLTVEEANKLTYSKASSGGFARQYKGNDPRSRLNKGDAQSERLYDQEQAAKKNPKKGKCKKCGQYPAYDEELQPTGKGLLCEDCAEAWERGYNMRFGGKRGQGEHLGLTENERESYRGQY